MKIALLANTERQEQVFTKGHIDTLGEMGELLINELTAGPDEAEAAKIIKDADIAITSWDCPALTENVLTSAPNLKLIVHAAGSVKGIVTDKMWEQGIRISSGAAALGRGVAETALGLSITALKNIYNLNKLTSMGGWNSQNHTVTDIYNVTFGIIGAGYAGRHFIKLLHSFEVDIVLYDPTMSEKECTELGVKKVNLMEMMKVSDVVSLHAPSLPVTKNMINSLTLSAMKDGAVLINTARGTLVNESDLIAELRKGRITACIDVTSPEPPAELSELRLMPNVILTPHIAGAVTNGRKRIGKLVIDEISSFLKDSTLEYEVLRSQLSKLA